MLTLGIDLSTTRASVAILDGEETVREEAWDDQPFRRTSLFSVLRSFLNDLACPPRQIGLFAPGLGPGSFGGLRSSLAACLGMALPFGTPVRGVPSYEALAADASARRPEWDRVVVVGDARRALLWIATFVRGGAGLRKETPCELLAWDDVPRRMRQPALVVSPDWGRIGPRIRPLLPAASEVVPESMAPRASTVARMAVVQHLRGEPAAPLAPIYLHPAVADHGLSQAR